MTTLYVSTHVVIGAAAGSLVAGVPTAIVAGVASHVLADMVPHHDYNTTRAGLTDTALTLGLICLGLWTRMTAPVMAGAVAAAVPDIEIGLRHLGARTGPLLFPSHSGLIPHGRSSRTVGAWLQGAAVAGSLLVLLSRWR